jgi:AraC-like DNA-binding protein/predicted transcriptional regulator YdeE
VTVSARIHRVHRAVLFIEPRLFTPLRAQDVANAVGGALSELQRQVTQVYGISVAAYIRARRLSEAARMLRTGQSGILGIALLCQYTSQAAFSRAFKSHFGVAPGAYRKGLGAAHAEVSAASVQELIHREALPRSPSLQWLHADRPLLGVVQRVDPRQLADFQRVQETLVGVVGERHEAVGMVTSPGESQCMDLFLGVDDPGTGDPSLLHKDSLQAGLYAVFRHKGPAEMVRHSIARFVQAWNPGPAMLLGRRADAEIFALDQRHSPELALELWVAVDAQAG